MNRIDLAQALDAIASQPLHNQDPAVVQSILRQAAEAIRTSWQPTEVSDAKDVFRFRVMRPIAGKNRKVNRAIFHKQKKKWVAISHDSTEHKDARKHIEAIAVEAMRQQFPKQFAAGMPIWDRHDVSCYLKHDWRTDVVDALLIGGRRPTEKQVTGRKSDLQNIDELLLDALQGIAFKNDNQVSRLVMERTPW